MYTFLTNKEGHDGQATLVAIIEGTKVETVTAVLEKVLYHCYLDNDDAGRRVVDSLHELLGDKVQDMFAPYPLYKDLNDFLRNKKKIP